MPPRFPTAPTISSPPTTLTSAAKTLIGAKLLQLAATNCTTGGHLNTRNHTTRAGSGTCSATCSRSTGPRADGSNHHGSGDAWIENRLKVTRGSAKNRAGSVFTYAEDLVTELCKRLAHNELRRLPTSALLTFTPKSAAPYYEMDPEPRRGGTREGTRELGGMADHQCGSPHC